MRISIICPFYNESAILSKAIAQLLNNLKKMAYEWETVLVNDGSTDDSLNIAMESAAKNPKIKIVSYTVNQGRGYALKRGIDEADGDVIITTEIDLSWGDDIVYKIVKKFESEPALDVVVASPNIQGGGYKNVPLRRVLLSRLGNFLIRALFTKSVTMNTGMTRGYRKEAIKNLPVFEKGKEFHLEVLLKLMSLGCKIGEVPAVLEWKDKRISSSKTKKLIISHLNFAIFANPIRYFWAFGAASGLLGAAFIANALYRLATGAVAVYMALTGFSLLIIAILLFGFGILANQNNFVLRELWRLQKMGGNK